MDVLETSRAADPVRSPIELLSLPVALLQILTDHCESNMPLTNRRRTKATPRGLAGKIKTGTTAFRLSPN